MEILAKIKRLAIARRLRFTFKADLERIGDGLTVEDIVESLVNAPAINKVLRSHSPKIHGVEEYYLLISSKRDI